jgi:hypothetical protein
VAAIARQVDVVHGGAPDALVVDRKAARLDDVQRRAQTGGKTNESAETSAVYRARIERGALISLPSAVRVAKAGECGTLSQPAFGPACDQSEP